MLDRRIFSAAVWLVVGFATAQAQTQLAPSPSPSAEERAILGIDEAFVKAYNAGDVKAVADFFTEDAEIVEADGLSYRGRDLIAESLAETFKADKGAKIAFDVESIRFLTPDSAKEVGRSIVTPATGPAVSTLYTVLYVRREDRWRIADVREEPDPAIRPHDRLAELAWLVGAWLEEDADAHVRVDCRWSEDGNFLIRSIAVSRQGRPAQTVTQRIGWDPLAKQIRSWDFDSEGGYGEGRWTRDGDRWIVKHSGVRPEGAVASSVNVMTRERSDLVRWTSTHRVVAGRSEPDEVVHALVRVPAAPATSDSVRSPR